MRCTVTHSGALWVDLTHFSDAEYLDSTAFETLNFDEPLHRFVYSFMNYRFAARYGLFSLTLKDVWRNHQ